MKYTKLHKTEKIKILNDEIKEATYNLDKTIQLSTNHMSDGGIVINDREAKCIKLAVKVLSRKIHNMLEELNKILH